MTLRAELLTTPTPDTVHQIVEACNAHRPWFPDHLWEHSDRRSITTAHIAKLYYAMAAGDGALWGVWRDSTIVGIISIGDVVPQTDAKCHFVFFDHKLADKRDLCINLMRWCFERLDLHRLSVEIPTYARVLAKFARKLGFRYEAEGRKPFTHRDERLDSLGLAQAYIGSRRYRATLYEGQWHDVLLLTMLREEFDERYGRTSSGVWSIEGGVQDPGSEAPRSQPDSSSPGVAKPEHRLPAVVHAEPAEFRAGASAADLGTPAADLGRME